MTFETLLCIYQDTPTASYDRNKSTLLYAVYYSSKAY